MLTFAILVSYVAVAAILFGTATFLGTRRSRSDAATWGLYVLTVVCFAGGLVSLGGAFATLHYAVRG